MYDRPAAPVRVREHAIARLRNEASKIHPDRHRSIAKRICERGRALVERLSKDSLSISKNNGGGIAGILYTVRIMTGKNTNFLS
jgi:hypothetical protein